MQAGFFFYETSADRHIVVSGDRNGLQCSDPSKWSGRTDADRDKALLY